MTAPTPPEGYTLHRQVLLDDQRAQMQPPIPFGAMLTLLVYNGWQDRWEKPKYLFTGEPCWYAAADDEGVAMACPKCGNRLIRHYRDGSDPVTVRCATCHVMSAWAATVPEAVDKLRKDTP